MATNPYFGTFSASEPQNQEHATTLNMNPQLLDTIKGAHCNTFIAILNKAKSFGGLLASSKTATENDKAKARTETMASINALNCAFVRFVGDSNFLIIRPAEKEAAKMYRAGKTFQNRWGAKAYEHVDCDKTQKDLQKSALMDAINSAKVRHCEGPGGNVTFELEIKSEVIRQMKQLLGEAEINEMLESTKTRIQLTYESAIASAVQETIKYGNTSNQDRTLRDAVSLGIDKKWLNEQAQKAVDKYRDEQRRLEERIRNESLANIEETVALLQNPSQG